MVESVKEFTHIKVLMILFCILTRNNYATRYRPIYSFVVGKSYTFPQLNVGFRNQTEYSNKIYFNYYNMWVLSGVSLIRKYWLKVKVSKDAFLFAIDYAVYDWIILDVSLHFEIREYVQLNIGFSLICLQMNHNILIWI